MSQSTRGSILKSLMYSLYTFLATRMPQWPSFGLDSNEIRVFEFTAQVTCMIQVYNSAFDGKNTVQSIPL